MSMSSSPFVEAERYRKLLAQHGVSTANVPPSEFKAKWLAHMHGAAHRVAAAMHEHSERGLLQRVRTARAIHAVHTKGDHTARVQRRSLRLKNVLGAPSSLRTLPASASRKQKAADIDIYPVPKRSRSKAGSIVNDVGAELDRAEHTVRFVESIVEGVETHAKTFSNPETTVEEYLRPRLKEAKELLDPRAGLKDFGNFIVKSLVPKRLPGKSRVLTKLTQDRLDSMNGRVGEYLATNTANVVHALKNPGNLLRYQRTNLLNQAMQVGLLPSVDPIDLRVELDSGLSDLVARPTTLQEAAAAQSYMLDSTPDAEGEFDEDFQDAEEEPDEDFQDAEGEFDEDFQDAEGEFDEDFHDAEVFHDPPVQSAEEARLADLRINVKLNDELQSTSRAMLAAEERVNTTVGAERTEAQRALSNARKAFNDVQLEIHKRNLSRRSSGEAHELAARVHEKAREMLADPTIHRAKIVPLSANDQKIRAAEADEVVRKANERAARVQEKAREMMSRKIVITQADEGTLSSGIESQIAESKTLLRRMEQPWEDATAETIGRSKFGQKLGSSLINNVDRVAAFRSGVSSVGKVMKVVGTAGGIAAGAVDLYDIGMAASDANNTAEFLRGIAGDAEDLVDLAALEFGGPAGVVIATVDMLTNLGLGFLHSGILKYQGTNQEQSKKYQFVQDMGQIITEPPRTSVLGITAEKLATDRSPMQAWIEDTLNPAFQRAVVVFVGRLQNNGYLLTDDKKGLDPKILQYALEKQFASAATADKDIADAVRAGVNKVFQSYMDTHGVATQEVAQMTSEYHAMAKALYEAGFDDDQIASVLTTLPAPEPTQHITNTLAGVSDALVAMRKANDYGDLQAVMQLMQNKKWTTDQIKESVDTISRRYNSRARGDLDSKEQIQRDEEDFWRQENLLLMMEGKPPIRDRETFLALKAGLAYESAVVQSMIAAHWRDVQGVAQGLVATGNKETASKATAIFIANHLFDSTSDSGLATNSTSNPGLTTFSAADLALLAELQRMHANMQSRGLAKDIPSITISGGRSKPGLEVKVGSGRGMSAQDWIRDVIVAYATMYHGDAPATNPEAIKLLATQGAYDRAITATAAGPTPVDPVPSECHCPP